MNKIKVGVIGASGYTGITLLKFLLKHPKVNLTKITSESYVNMNLGDYDPYFQGKINLNFTKINYDKLKENCEIIFFATSHGVSMKHVKFFYNSSVKLIDLSGDYRLSSSLSYKKWYGSEHNDKESLNKWVYGLSEIFKEEIKNANYISNPGCYSSAILLAILPLYKFYNSINNIICDVKSGISGRGRKLNHNSLFVECNENLLAYNLVSHPHIPEIEQAIKKFSGKIVKIIFSPHLIPMNRGILATIYIKIKDQYLTENKIRNYYQEFYKTSYFVKMLKTDQLAQTKYVNGNNECHISFVFDKRNKMLKIISVIDNLIKGASGSAIQNFNLINNFEEYLGLN